MKKTKYILKIILLLIFTFIIVYLMIYAYAFITPKFKLNINNNITYYDINNNDIYSNSEYNDYVSLENINDYTKQAIISIEDKNFYKHKGFDFLRIVKAMFINIKNKKILQGASTISQQYVKNLYLTFDKTWKRKIEEAFLTVELETHYTKEQILEGYLNTIDFGAGNYGIYNASKYYFNKEPKDLSIEEATILVGIPKSPANYNPIINYENAKKRQKQVLKSMVENNYITKKEMDNIYNKEIIFYGKNDNIKLSSISYYRDAITYELNNIKEIPKSLAKMDGIKIYTNLNINIQRELENNIKNEMKDTKMEVASIVINPKNGKVLALIGGSDYNKTEYNRVLYSKRQVGSTIKPFLYYAALENGFNASTTFLSEKTTFNLGNSTYSPKNANNVYANKNISMLAAISYSDNIYAMKTHLFLGMNKLSDTMKRVKVKTKIEENASSALGTTEINMLDYSNGYITLANEGKHEKPHLIEKIIDNKGNIIYEYKYNNEYILNNKYVYILNNLLTSTYDYSMVNYTSPTLLNIRNNLNKKFAVKSGSTSTDYWTIGYNNNFLVMVWNGNDDNSKVNSKDSKISKNIWSKTISNIETNNEWYEIPKGVIGTTIDKITGEIKENGYLCYYEKGSEPNYINNTK